MTTQTNESEGSDGKTDLSKFFDESVEFGLSAIGPVLGGTSSHQCFLEFCLEIGEVGLETSLVVAQVSNRHRHLVDSHRQFTDLCLGVLPPAL